MADTSHDQLQRRQGERADAQAIETVRAFLAAVERRDFMQAESFLHGDFEMVFPGDRRMTKLAELAQWAGTRYRFVRKSYDHSDVAGAVVYCIGTLSGEWRDGTAFAGIRFIDRFELCDGLIRRQDVWNDIAETRTA